MPISTDKFKSLITEVTGFDKDYQWPVSVEKVIQSFMKQLNIQCRGELYQKLKSSSDLTLDFIQQFTINETYFNREPLLFELASNVLVPEILIKKQPKCPLNILSAGCSTGEEPYSLVIAMMERYGVGCYKLFNFFAVDIDLESIMIAQKAVYNRRAVHMLDSRLIETYFYQKDSNQFQLKNIIKNSVIFSQNPLQKITKSFPLQKMDIIFYRNVSIYLDPITRKKIFNELADLLNPNGFIVMSPTETFSHDFKRLNLINKEGIFVFYCDTQKQITTDHSFETKSENFSHLPQKDSLKQVVELANRKYYAYALEQLDVFIKTQTDHVQANLLKACILINKQELQEARFVCETIYADDALNEAACLLLGLVNRLENKMNNAQEFFSKVLYINTNNWLAHYYLAKIYEEHKQLKLAVNGYQKVIYLLEKGEFHKHGLLFFPMSFSKSDILFLCNSRINELKEEA